LAERQLDMIDATISHYGILAPCLSVAMEKG
jgi:hypothetical protein